MKHLIAIVTVKDVYFNYGDDYETIVASISEWSEVTDDELELLQKYCGSKYGNGKYNYQIIERVDLKPNFVAKTVEQFKKLAEREEIERKERLEREELERKEKARLKAERAAAKQLKQARVTAEAEKALLVELANKHGVEIEVQS